MFTRTKHGANRLSEKLDKSGISSAAIHGNKSQNARTKALAGFKDGTIRTLVATDIAARGIDVEGISHVINYDFPPQAEDYVHRIGRTGRARTEGEAFTLCKPEDISMVESIEKLLGNPLPRKFVDDFSYRNDPESLTPSAPEVSRKRNRGFGKQLTFGGRRRR